MKRAIRMLGALAVLAGFFLAAPAANAACTTYPVPPIANTPSSNINNWPRNTDPGSSPAVSMAYYCASGSASTDTAFGWTWQAAQQIGNAVSTATPKYNSNLFTTNHQRVYFFENLAALNSEWGTSYSNPGGGVYVLGVTLGSGDPHNASIPVGSVGILKKRSDGTTIPQATVKRTVYHELGHAFDRIKGFPSFNGGSNYNTAKANDIYDLDHETRANAFNGVTIPANCQALYNQPWNPATQTGTSNWTVALCVFTAADTSESHFFANVFGFRLGGSIVNVPLGNFISNKFHDTKLYMDSVATGGTP